MLLKKCQIILLILLSFGGVKISAAQDTLRLSLNDALKMAQENNLNIKNSQLDLKISQKKIWETIAIGLPHIDGTAKYQFIPKVATLPASTFDPKAAEGAVIELGVKQNIVYDLTVSQLIFNGAYLIGLKASKVYYNLSEESLEKAQLEINESVTNTYFMILVGQESRKILLSNLKNVNKTFEEIKEMYKQGFVEKTDVDQLELTANTITNAISQIGNNLEMAGRLLKIHLGLAENANITLTDQLQMEEAQVVKLTALASEPFILDKSVDFKMLTTAELLAKYDYKREMTNSLPTISAYYNRQEKWKKPAFDFAPKDVIGITLSVPIFSSGQRSATVYQKKMAFEKATNNKLYVSNTLFMQSSQCQNDLRTKLEKFQIQKKSKELSDDIYQRTLEKYKQGVSSSMELMTIQNQYLNNLTNYFQGIYDVVGAKTKLEKLFNINQKISK
ncbi:MAG: TolC family protein [Bacteroidia bacterium]|nr:TolC family protein [Bacteroidia bacterium]